MNTLQAALNEKKNGMHYGTRVLLPFKVEILKAVIDDDLIMDFSHYSEGAFYKIYDKYTEIYFFNHKDILADVSKYETIKLIVVEESEDIFDFNNHIRLSLNPLENHKLEISILHDDVLFID
ncbi:MAG: hypothetical protein CR986_05325 [Ignavibacteriae bacterium]|nr:MAG: hypothetical protein CR986_05325 [Ignavibacteriota bacterium]